MEEIKKQGEASVDSIVLNIKSYLNKINDVLYLMKKNGYDTDDLYSFYDILRYDLLDNDHLRNTYDIMHLSAIIRHLKYLNDLLHPIEEDLLQAQQNLEDATIPIHEYRPIHNPNQLKRTAISIATSLGIFLGSTGYGFHWYNNQIIDHKSSSEGQYEVLEEEDQHSTNEDINPHQKENEILLFLLEFTGLVMVWGFSLFSLTMRIYSREEIEDWKNLFVNIKTLLGHKNNLLEQLRNLNLSHQEMAKYEKIIDELCERSQKLLDTYYEVINSIQKQEQYYKLKEKNQQDAYFQEAEKYLDHLTELLSYLEQIDHNRYQQLIQSKKELYNQLFPEEKENEKVSSF